MHTSLGILLFDDVEVLDFAGPFEVFSLAGAFDVSLIGTHSPIIARNGLSVNPHKLTKDVGPLDVLLIPGGPGTRVLVNDQAFMNSLQVLVRAVPRLMTVCTGALLLAKLGLLKNKVVTTHHDARELLKTIDPSVEISSERYVNHGDLLMSAGVSAGIDMSLYAVAKYCGLQVAESVAKRMEYVSAGLTNR